MTELPAVRARPARDGRGAAPAPGWAGGSGLCPGGAPGRFVSAGVAAGGFEGRGKSNGNGRRGRQVEVVKWVRDGLKHFTEVLVHGKID